MAATVEDFEPGELVWFDPGVGYSLPGEVLEYSAAAGVVIVQAIVAGEPKPFTLHSLQAVRPREDLGQDGVADMIELGDLCEASVLWNLKLRYDRQHIYTNIGSILLSVNPYRLFDIYGTDAVKRYEGQIHGTLPPHIFATASAAYQKLSKGGGEAENQVVVISGESGSGKTESTKLILQYLAAVNRSANNLVTEQILEASPLLEAFGNAKTVKNDNSSRFGKYMQVFFNDGVITGARTIDYLLEKSRIVTQAADERNYHVFYELLAGLSDQEKEKYGLQSADRYFYLNQGGCVEMGSKNDAEDFRALLGALQVLGLSSEETDVIFRILAAVLHLGNVYFHRKPLKHGQEGVEVGSEAEVRWASHLLQTPAEGILRALTMKATEARGERLLTPLNIDQALDARDAIAKALYSTLFSWLVQRVNAIVFKGPRRASIAILDIFGFENLQENSFEQLCINYANETLHSYLNRHVFKLEQAEYAKERIEWTPIGYPDNQAVIALIAKKPVGILHLLDDESNFPKASDVSYLEKCHYNHALNELYSRPRMSSLEFGIRHYAGQVWYSVDGFLDKNRDTLRPDVTELLIASKIGMISKMFIQSRDQQAIDPQQLAQLQQGRTVGSARHDGRFVTMKPRAPTVAARFHDSLQALVDQMSHSNPWFIRCFKPNTDKVPMRLDMPLVLEQVRYSGILDTVRIRKIGYPIRFRFASFADRYRCLLPEGVARATPPRDVCQRILDRISAAQNQYQLGQSKVFLREPLEQMLDQARAAKIRLSIVTIQKHIRGHLARRRYDYMRRSAIRIQAAFRAHSARQKYLKVRRGVIRAQASWRMQRARRSYRRLLESVKLRREAERQARERAEREQREREQRERATFQHLELPPELSAALSTIDDWQCPQTERNIVKAGERPQRRPRRVVGLPADIDSHVFSKFTNIYFKSHQWGLKTEPIKTPFLAKAHEQDNRDAVSIFKLILRFMYDTKLSGTRERLVGDYIVQRGLARPSLRDEIFCQLATQTCNNNDASSRNRCWLLMANCLSCFPPSRTLYKYLLKYVSDHAAADNYACHCQRLLLRIGAMDAKLARTYPPTLLEWRNNANRFQMGLEVRAYDDPLDPTALDDRPPPLVVEVHSWTTGNEFAADALHARAIDDGLSGWSADLVDAAGAVTYSLNGADYLMDLVSETEIPPGFDTCKSFYLVSIDRARLHGNSETALSSTSHPATAAFGSLSGPHHPDRYNIYEADLREIPPAQMSAASGGRLLSRSGQQANSITGGVDAGVSNGLSTGGGSHDGLARPASGGQRPQHSPAGGIGSRKAAHHLSTNALGPETGRKDAAPARSRSMDDLLEGSLSVGSGEPLTSDPPLSKRSALNDRYFEVRRSHQQLNRIDASSREHLAAVAAGDCDPAVASDADEDVLPLSTKSRLNQRYLSQQAAAATTVAGGGSATAVTEVAELSPILGAANGRPHPAWQRRLGLSASALNERYFDATSANGGGEVSSNAVDGSRASTTVLDRPSPLSTIEQAIEPQDKFGAGDRLPPVARAAAAADFRYPHHPKAGGKQRLVMEGGSRPAGPLHHRSLTQSAVSGPAEYTRSSAMSDCSEAPSLASHVRHVKVPSHTADLDQYLDELFNPVLDGDDGLSDARSLAASLKGRQRDFDDDSLIEAMGDPVRLSRKIKGMAFGGSSDDEQNAQYPENSADNNATSLLTDHEDSSIGGPKTPDPVFPVPAPPPPPPPLPTASQLGLLPPRSMPPSSANPLTLTTNSAAESRLASGKSAEGRATPAATLRAKNDISGLSAAPANASPAAAIPLLQPVSGIPLLQPLEVQTASLSFDDDELSLVADESAFGLMWQDPVALSARIKGITQAVDQSAAAGNVPMSGNFAAGHAALFGFGPAATGGQPGPVSPAGSNVGGASGGAGPSASSSANGNGNPSAFYNLPLYNVSGMTVPIVDASQLIQQQVLQQHMMQLQQRAFLASAVQQNLQIQQQLMQQSAALQQLLQSSVSMTGPATADDGLQSLQSAASAPANLHKAASLFPGTSAGLVNPLLLTPATLDLSPHSVPAIPTHHLHQPQGSPSGGFGGRAARPTTTGGGDGTNNKSTFQNVLSELKMKAGSSSDPPLSPASAKRRAADLYGRAKTIRIGKWRWPPPRDAKGNCIQAPGQPTSFSEFKRLKREAKKQAKRDAGLAGPDDDDIEVSSSDDEKYIHGNPYSQAAAGLPASVLGSGSDGGKNGVLAGGNVISAVSNKDKIIKAFEGRSRPDPGSIGKIRISNEMKCKLEQLTIDHSVRSKSSGAKAAAASASHVAAAFKLAEDRRTTLERQLHGWSDNQAHKWTDGRTPPAAGAHLQQQSAARHGEPVDSGAGATDNLVKNKIRKMERVSQQINSAAGPHADPLSLANSPSKPSYCYDVENGLLDSQVVGSSAAGAPHNGGSKKSQRNQLGPPPPPPGGATKKSPTTQLSEYEDVRSTSTPSTLQQVEHRGGGRASSARASSPTVGNGQLQTRLYPLPQTPFLLYANTRWQLRIRKEVFSPAESLPADPAAVQLIFAQIVREVCSGATVRLTSAELGDLRALLAEFGITESNVNAPAAHKPHVKAALIDRCRQMPNYFARIFPVSTGSAGVGQPQLVAVSHSGVRLLRREREPSGRDCLRVLETIAFEDVADASLARVSTLQLLLRDGGWLTLFSPKAPHIHAIVERFAREARGSPASTTPFVRAVADYRVSSDGLLGFRRGDIIRVLHPAAANVNVPKGWLYGTLESGQCGLFPTEYVAPLQAASMPPPEIVGAAADTSHHQWSQIDYNKDETRAVNSRDVRRIERSAGAVVATTRMASEGADRTGSTTLMNGHHHPLPHGGGGSHINGHASELEVVGESNSRQPPLGPPVSGGETLTGTSHMDAAGKFSMLQFAMFNFRECLEKYDVLRDRDKHSIRGSVKMIESLKQNKQGKKKAKKGNHEGDSDWTWRELTELVKFSKSPIQKSLMPFESVELNKVAVECFVQIMRYMGDYPMAKGQLEVDCVYSVLSVLHKYPALHDEVYCQVMKQCTSNKSSRPDSCQKGWRFLSIVTAYFDCSEGLRPYLFHFLETAAYDMRRAFHGTAMVCLQNLRKTFRYGGRKNVPSIEEIAAISAGRNSKRQMYRLPGGTERVINTRSTTVVDDIVEDICSVLGVTDPLEMDEFSLYCIVEGDPFTMPLSRDEYILDVTTELLKNEHVFYLIFCRSVWYYPLRLDNSLYIEVIFNQVAPDYLEGLLLVTEGDRLTESAVRDIAQIAALLHRAANMQHLPTKDEVKYLLPKPVLPMKEIKPPQWVEMVQSHWPQVLSAATAEAKAQCLAILQRWPLFGSCFFNVRWMRSENTSQEHVLALNRDGVHFLDVQTHETVWMQPFSEVISTRKVQAEDGTLFLDMKCGNLMQQKITRIQTDQAHEISRLVRQYINIEQGLQGKQQGNQLHGPMGANMTLTRHR